MSARPDDRPEDWAANLTSAEEAAFAAALGLEAGTAEYEQTLIAFAVDWFADQDSISPICHGPFPDPSDVERLNYAPEGLPT